jgi:hypothetical protein
MITLGKWYPMVQPKHSIQTEAFAKMVERRTESYKLDVAAQKVRDATAEYDLELYMKRCRVNTIELEMFSNRRRFEIFV